MGTTSIPAREVAKEVLATVGQGQKPNIKQIAIKKGYSPKTAGAGIVQKTKSYKAEIAPLVQRLEEERDAIIIALKKKRSKAKYADLISGLDKITKNIQLLTGGSTSNVLIGVKKLNDDELQRLADGE